MSKIDSGSPIASGSWTPIDASVDGVNPTVTDAKWVCYGDDMVEASCRITMPASVTATIARIGGLPFTVANRSAAGVPMPVWGNFGSALLAIPQANQTYVQFSLAGVFTSVSNGTLNGSVLIFTAKYRRV